MDSYDQAHPTTGSGNISRATPEWLEVLAIARERCVEVGDPVLHMAYQIINEQTFMGIQWAKCPNCGSPFRMDREGAGDTLCSDTCFDEYSAYIATEGRGF
jgi:hypothetical protein